jgi:hypothetical protein
MKGKEIVRAAAFALAACALGLAEAAVVVVDSGGVCTLPNAISFIRDREDSGH